MFDVLAVVPCTSNTLAKLANGIVDTTVTMAVKSHLRNNNPVVIGVSTNDALGAAAKNIGALLNYKNYYFVPFGMDNYEKNLRVWFAILIRFAKQSKKHKKVKK